MEYAAGALHAAAAVVGENAGGGVVDVAAGPLLVGHPEVLDHFGLAGIVFLKDLPVEKALFGKGLGELVLLPLFLNSASV